MMDTIGSMVHGDRQKYRGVATAHVTGGMLGGSITGLIAAAAGAVIVQAVRTFDRNSGPLWLGLLVLSAALWHNLRGAASFGTRRQTPAGWRYSLPPRVFALLYGADLGAGISTKMYFGSFVTLLVLAGFSESILFSVAILALFGAVRAAGVLLLHRNRPEVPVDSLAFARPLVVRADSLAVMGGMLILLLRWT
jgi:hypothetical protein